MNLNTAFRELTNEEHSLVDGIKDGAQDLFRLMETAFKDSKTNGRELALAKTNLEQSVMWAVKAVSAEDVQPKVADEPAPQDGAPKEEKAKEEQA